MDDAERLNMRLKIRNKEANLYKQERWTSLKVESETKKEYRN